jgi:hypothetical protein
MWNEAVMAFLKEVYQPYYTMPGRTQKNHKKAQSAWLASEPKIKPATSQLQSRLLTTQAQSMVLGVCFTSIYMQKHTTHVNLLE